MAELSEKMQAQKEKMQSKLYMGLCIVMFIAIAVYTFTHYREYSFLKDAVNANKNLTTVLRQKTAQELANYELLKDDFDEFRRELEQKLIDIYPPFDQKTSLIRQIDSFEESLSTLNDPFVISNLDFQEAIVEENYSILPFRMNIRSSSANFQKFLHFIEDSGALENQVRLMDINSIRLTFEESAVQSDDAIINFSVQVNAYFQKI